MLSPSLFQLPPSAACTANPSTIGTNGGLVQFSAAGSFHPDPDESIVAYAWDFGDGTTGTGQTTSHTFARPASYPTVRNVTVTVTDTQGLSTSSTCPVTIVDTNVPPNAVSGGPYTVCSGSPVILDASASSDEDGEIAAYAWSWSSPINFSSPNATTAVVDATAAFTAMGVGSHNVGLRVTDNDGASTTRFTTVTIKAANDTSCNQPPTAVNDTVATVSGQAIGVEVLPNDTDPDGDTLSVTAYTQASNGAVIFHANQTFTYNPVPGFAGTDSFTYTISDGRATSTATVTITVTKRQAIVRAGSGTKTYGSADPVLTPTWDGFTARDNVVVTQASRDAGEQVGTYATHATASGPDVVNFDVTYQPGTLTITKATPVATAVGGTFTYDGQPHGGTCSVTGMNGDVLVGTTTYSTGGAPVNAGNHTITCSFAGDDNYNAASDTDTIVIAKAQPTARVTGGTFTYDGQPHGGACAVAGPNGEALAGSLKYTSGTTPVNAGTYGVTCYFEGNENYLAANEAGTIVIGKATPVADAVGGTFTYDGQPHGGTCSVTGVGSDTLTGVTTYSTGGTPVNAGNHTITCSFAGDDNYNAASDTDAIVIRKATPTADAVGGSHTYDGQPHGGTCSVTGVNGEVLAGTTTYSTGGAPVTAGSHTITCSFAGDDNYNAATDTDAIVITPATLTVTAVSVSRHWGTPNPPLTVGYAGFQGADDPSVLGGSLSVTTTAAQYSPVGTYPITASGLTSSNYAIVYVAGTLTVTNDNPVCSGAAPSVTMIWSPNHQWVPVTVLGVTDPNGDAFTIRITSIFQDEPVGSANNSTGPDGQGVGSDTAQVRASRAGDPKTPGDGRMYHISFTATDAAGGSCSGTVRVGVPHDQSGRAGTMVDGGAIHDSTVPTVRR
ncbi:MAG TPA: MBG domain-containing protein [Vicinamibacterales bacterium]|nr:MBG domain-containing protein [Vicinamibacterales bacterium]